jgi:uncharacterized protein YuzE
MTFLSLTGVYPCRTMHFVASLARVIRHPICSIRYWMTRDLYAHTPAPDLRLKYEREHDLLSVWVGAPQLSDTVEVEPGVCVRVSPSWEVIGVEVVDAAARLNQDAATLQDPAFAQKLLDRYGRAALTELRVSHAR